MVHQLDDLMGQHQYIMLHGLVMCCTENLSLRTEGFYEASYVCVCVCRGRSELRLLKVEGLSLPLNLAAVSMTKN